MVRSRDRARTAALQAEVVALRATVARLRDELAQVRAAAAVPAAAEVSWVALQMPLVQLALGDPEDVAAGPEVAAALAAPDRSPDTAETEIVLEPAPAAKLAWTVLANLPEGPLLDPRADRDAEPRDPAEAVVPTAAHAHRRTA
jgi:hypothetical protein